MTPRWPCAFPPCISGRRIACGPASRRPIIPTRIPAVFNYYSVGTAREKAEKEGRARCHRRAALAARHRHPVAQDWPRRSSPLFLHVMDMGHEARVSLHFYQGVVSPADQESFTATAVPGLCRDGARLSGLLASILAPGLFGAEMDDPGQAVLLHPEEEALVAGAVRKTAARICPGPDLRPCRAGAAGHRDAGPSARADDGAPLWPAGIVGSITHTQGYAAALVAVAADFPASAWMRNGSAASRRICGRACSMRRARCICAAPDDAVQGLRDHVSSAPRKPATRPGRGARAALSRNSCHAAVQAALPPAAAAKAARAVMRCKAT